MRPGRLLAPLLPRPDTGGRLPRAAIGVGIALAVTASLVLALLQQVVGSGSGSEAVLGSRAAGSASSAQVRGESGTYAFTLRQPHDRGRPVTWDPCRVIPIVVNDRLAPAGGDQLLDEALAEVSRASGLRFARAGRTDRLPAARRTGQVPAREPALVAWTTPEQVPALRGDVAGVGGSTARPDRETRDLEYVTGVVALDQPQLVRVLQRPDGRERTRAILVHEIAHLVGLDHVDDPGELMYAANVGRLDLGPGDREGLAALGRGHCY